MTMRRALQAIFVISLMGIAFSGALTVRELCDAGSAGCTAAGPPGTILGYPACVYGLVMYVLIAAIAGLGLKKGA